MSEILESRRPLGKEKWSGLVQVHPDVGFIILKKMDNAVAALTLVILGMILVTNECLVHAVVFQQTGT